MSLGCSILSRERILWGSPCSKATREADDPQVAAQPSTGWGLHTWALSLHTQTFPPHAPYLLSLPLSHTRSSFSLQDSWEIVVASLLSKPQVFTQSPVVVGTLTFMVLRHFCFPGPFIPLKQNIKNYILWLWTIFYEYTISWIYCYK